jgi:hypothetical protein
MMGMIEEDGRRVKGASPRLELTHGLMERRVLNR